MHSALAIATRPHIWREVLVALGSRDKTEAGISRLERAKRPHIAPFIRALFLSLFPSPWDNPDDFLPPIVAAISLFKSMRVVCVGKFQQFQTHYREGLHMQEALADAIRAHPRINGLYVNSMGCADLIEENSSKAYALELHNCGGSSVALLLRPKAISFLRINGGDLEKLQTNWPPDVWKTLKHFDPGSGESELQNMLRGLQVSDYDFVQHATQKT